MTATKEPLITEERLAEAVKEPSTDKMAVVLQAAIEPVLLGWINAAEQYASDKLIGFNPFNWLREKVGIPAVIPTTAEEILKAVQDAQGNGTYSDGVLVEIIERVIRDRKALGRTV